MLGLGLGLGLGVGLERLLLGGVLHPAEATQPLDGREQLEAAGGTLHEGLGRGGLGVGEGELAHPPLLGEDVRGHPLLAQQRKLGGP